jgi:hypothetical protein
MDQAVSTIQRTLQENQCENYCGAHEKIRAKNCQSHGAASLLKKTYRKKYTPKHVAHLMKKYQEECDKDGQEDQDWAFKNTTSVTKRIHYHT